MSAPNQPLFNVPGSVLAVIALLVAIHAVRFFMPADLDNWFVVASAFVPSRYAGDMQLLPGGLVSAVLSPVTYQLVHGNLTHLLFNGLWLLAFGGAIAMRVGTRRFLAFTLFAGIVSAAIYLAFHWGARTPVIGASGAVAGLMGGTMRFLFSALDSGGIWRLREAPRSVALMPLKVALTDKRVLVATAILVGINLLTFAGVDSAGVDAASIAWEAHIGGYLAGLLTFGFFDGPKPKRPHLRPVPTLH